METIDNLLPDPHKDRGYTNPPQPKEQKQRSDRSEAVLRGTWLSLQNMGHISLKEDTNGIMYKTWSSRYGRFSANQQKKALDKAAEFDGYLKLPVFLKMCQGDRFRVEHRTWPGLNLPSSTWEERCKTAKKHLNEIMGMFDES